MVIMKNWKQVLNKGAGYLKQTQPYSKQQKNLSLYDLQEYVYNVTYCQSQVQFRLPIDHSSLVSTESLNADLRVELFQIHSQRSLMEGLDTKKNKGKDSTFVSYNRAEKKCCAIISVKKGKFGPKKGGETNIRFQSAILIWPQGRGVCRINTKLY